MLEGDAVSETDIDAMWHAEPAPDNGATPLKTLTSILDSLQQSHLAHILDLVEGTAPEAASEAVVGVVEAMCGLAGFATNPLARRAVKALWTTMVDTSPRMKARVPLCAQQVLVSTLSRTPFASLRPP